jgi:serine/threonine protein kinase/WD40 repeat protein
VDRVTPRIDQIYFSALEIATRGERCAYLDQACAGDEDLRRRVERLLCAESKVGDFLESPAPEIAAAFAPSLAERPGTVIGNYTLLEQIGEGGFGIVYIADQETPVRRQVALKIVRPGMDTREILARFKTELEALSLMDHPNIARVLDAGATETGRPYFVMELVRGVPITEYCDQNQLSVHARLGLFVQVCHAVQHAHQKGIIHRDIKPSNVLVTQHDGRPVPKVIDFGVAKAIDRQLTQGTLFTRFELIGTPLYMSPEQADLSSRDVDTRSDIYSLGVLLYELLTGRTPFDPDRLHEAAFDEVRRIIQEEEPPKPSTRIRTMGHTAREVAARRHADPTRLTQIVRGDLDWIVMKALEKDRARRYETANSLALDVERYLASEPVQASPPSAGYRLRKFVRRNRGLVLAASAVLVVLVVGIIGTTWGMVRATEAEAEAKRAADLKQIALTEKVAALGLAQQSERTRSEELWQALVAQARAHRLSRRPGQRFESLEILREATQLARRLNLSEASFQELRNAATAALAVPDLYMTKPWHPWPADAIAVDFDDAQTIYSRTYRDGNCSIRRVADDVEICRLPALSWPAMPCLSPDGKFIAIIQFNRSLSTRIAIHVWQLDGPTPRQILSEPKACWADFRGSQQVALAYNDGSIKLYALPTARELGRLAPDTITNRIGIALHPTEPVVAANSYVDRVLQLRDIRTGKVLKSTPQIDRCVGMAWHPDGRTLAVGSNLHEIRLYDRSTWHVYRTLQAESYPARMGFDSVGDRLAAIDYVGNVELFHVSTGEKLMRAPATLSTCHFSRDGLRLAGGVQDGKLGTWCVAGGQEFRALLRSKPLPKSGTYRGAAVHPDGHLFACSMADRIGIWDLDTGAELGLIPSEWGNNLVLFEPSGSLLTLSYGGLSRWPIRPGLNATGEVTIGPPESLPLPNGEGLDQSRDGRVTVTCDRAVSTQRPYAGGWILRSDQLTQPIHLDPGADVGQIAVSPDGRWVATSTHAIGLAKIWDARDGRLVKQLAEWGANRPRFSPDGRWLSTTLDGGRLFAVETWKPGPRLGGRSVMSPDSKLAAIATAGGLRLLESATSREIAVLEEPDLVSIDQALFTPDGTKLITLNNLKGIHVWDLRLVRRELKELGLDWEWPEFPSAPATRGSVEPLKVEIRLGDAWVAGPPPESSVMPEQKPSDKTQANPKNADSPVIPHVKPQPTSAS